MIQIRSDFTDYYDVLSNPNSNLIYNRFKQNSMSRGEALRFLRKYGIKTLNFGSVRTFNPLETPRLVVYTNQNSHDFLGKRVCTYDEAISQYGNCAASEFIESDGRTLKYLQIGSRRFRLLFHNSEAYRGILREGDLIAYEELPRQYNFTLRLPIYSIDYIGKNNDMIAVDFNEVQKLSSIGVQGIITEREVIEEIYASLINYHLI